MTGKFILNFKLKIKIINVIHLEIIKVIYGACAHYLFHSVFYNCCIETIILMTTTNYFNAMFCLERLIIPHQLTVSASTTSLPAWTYSSCKESTCFGCSNITSGTTHPARRYPRLSNSKTYPSETIMLSPSLILFRRPLQK